MHKCMKGNEKKSIERGQTEKRQKMLRLYFAKFCS